MAIKKILVPLDKSNLDFKVLQTALSIADRFGSQVIVLRVRRSGVALDMESEHATSADLDAFEAETRLAVAEAVNALHQEGTVHLVKAADIVAETRAGPVVEVIVAAADEHMVDLVVMGTHGRHGLTELFTGSTTEQVVAATPVSVLVVKPSGFPFLRD